MFAGFDARLTHDAQPTAIFHDLNTEQAHGHLCVICRADFTVSGAHAEPVGISATTRQQVFACVEPCAGAARREAEPGEQIALEAGR